MKISRFIRSILIIALIIMLMPAQTFAKESIKHNSKFKDFEKERGVDVSEWQGKIDWKKVAKDNIAFAVIRVAHRDPESGEILEDKCAKDNLKKAKDAGLKVGAYIFSQAISTEEAKEEALFADKVIRESGVELDLPLVMDFEYMSSWYGDSGRLYYAYLSQSQATNVCTSFFEVAEDKGYVPMIYGNKWMISSGVKADKLSKMGQIWIAEYEESVSYKGDYNFWQYSSWGKVSGIKGDVDLDYHYYQKNYTYDAKIKVETTEFESSSSDFDSLTLEWKALEGVNGYYIERYDPYSTSFVKVKEIEKADTTSWTDTKVNSSASYTYRIRAYKVEGDRHLGLSSYSQNYSAKTAAPIDGVVLGSDVYVRREGKMSGDILSKFDSKTEVKLVGGYGEWYKIRKTYEDSAITGYIYKDFVGPAAELLEAPATIKVDTKNFHSVTISWDKVANAEGYAVQRYNKDLEDFEDIVYLDGEETLSYTDGSLVAEQECTYRVGALTTIKEYQIAGDYTSELSGKAAKAATGKVTKKLKVRTAPEKDAEALKTVKAGEKLKVIGVSGDYYKVSITVKDKAKTGYVYKPCVSVQ